METLTISSAIMAAALAGATWHAWRLGNDKRDVALLGAIGGLRGVGAAVSAIA